MVNKKIYIILIVSLVVFFIVMFSLLGVKNIKEEQYSSTIIIGNSTVWTFSDKKWNNITYKSSLKNLSWEKYHVFSNKEYAGEYYLWHDDKWYVFDENKKAILLEGDLIAYSANSDLKLQSPSEKTVENFDYINYVLEKNDLSLSSKFTSIYKVDFDIDNDSTEEEFYIISNAFSMDFTPDKTFSIAFMVKEDTIYYLYKDVTDNKAFNGCKPYYNFFLDVNDDNKYELVLSCSKYSVIDQIDMLYEFNDNEFKILISNK